mmetsp:Transcript_58193/g.102354  ORF Transcript_58193/g.102354 Transcript_58193/m.102354 type:complete len:331 (-) Transcript_58193:524-1516(-)
MPMDANRSTSAGGVRPLPRFLLEPPPFSPPLLVFLLLFRPNVPNDPARLPPESGAGILGMVGRGLGAGGRVLKPPLLVERLCAERALSSWLLERLVEGAKLLLLVFFLGNSEAELLVLLYCNTLGGFTSSLVSHSSQISALSSNAAPPCISMSPKGSKSSPGCSVWASRAYEVPLIADSPGANAPLLEGLQYIRYSTKPTRPISTTRTNVVVLLDRSSGSSVSVSVSTGTLGAADDPESLSVFVPVGTVGVSVFAIVGASVNSTMGAFVLTTGTGTGTLADSSVGLTVGVSVLVGSVVGGSVFATEGLLVSATVSATVGVSVITATGASV